MAASAVTPLTPMELAPRLRARGRMGNGGGALERGHGAPLEPLAQLGDALRSVGALSTIVEAAELVVAQTAKVGSDSVNGR
eukprot:scaffold933_cov56-Phaeocystis_antarctica.AAC.6